MRPFPFGRIARFRREDATPSRRLPAWKPGVLLLAAIAALAVTSIAGAQSSPSFQLGCWGIVTAGGGVRASTYFRISDSIGQITAGQSASTNYLVRSGYIQPSLVVPNARASVITAPDESAQGVEIYIPILNRSVYVVYACPY